MRLRSALSAQRPDNSDSSRLAHPTARSTITRLIQLAAMVCACSFALIGTVRAATIVQFTDAVNTTEGVPGQSVTTPAGGPWDNITFNFYADVAATIPAASGDLFILTQEYLGLPSALSGSTPGFFAESTGVSGGVYLFDPSVILQGGTQYFFYGNQNFITAADTVNRYPGGVYYHAAQPFFDFFTIPLLDQTFNLSGTEVSAVPTVPEPASLTLLGLGLASIGARCWWQRKT
jgi:hypothetical protein